MPFKTNKLETLRLLPDEMKQKGGYLLQNPKQGKKILGKTPSGTKLKSNCFGTTIFLKGEKAYNKCKEIYENTNNSFILNDIPSLYWENNNRPGLIEVNIMQKYIEQYCTKTKNPNPGDIMVVEHFYKRGFWLVHTGIWTGIENYILEQHNKGQKFGLEKLSNHYNPYFMKKKISLT